MDRGYTLPIAIVWLLVVVFCGQANCSSNSECIKNGGKNYTGEQNETISSVGCLAWSSVSQCLGDHVNKDNLKDNFCRNPDRSVMPWCFTKLEGCQRENCLVCKEKDANEKKTSNITTNNTTNYNNTTNRQKTPGGKGSHTVSATSVVVGMTIIAGVCCNLV